MQEIQAGTEDFREKIKETECSATIVVAGTNNNNGRRYDKKQCCLFCHKVFSKLPRHFMQMHKNEAEVQRFMAMPPFSRERQEILDNLRSGGNYIYNTEVLEKKCGTLIPQRRKAEPTSPSKLRPCLYCNQLFMKKTLYRHYQNCKIKNKNMAYRRCEGLSRQRVVHSSKHLLPLPDKERYIQLLKNTVIDGMAEDDVSHEVKKDALITQFGAEMLEQYEHLPHLKNYIRNSLREITRFLIEIKKQKKNISCLRDVFNGSNFDTAVEAAKIVGGFDPETNSFRIPSLAKKIGEHLQKCAAICIKNGIKEKNVTLQANCKDFLSLYEKEWSLKITRKALRTLSEMKFNKPTQLPHPKDMVKITKFLEDERKEVLSCLKSSPTSKNYSRLCKLALAAVIIFNRKRAGDADKLLLDTYIQKNSEDFHPEVFGSLSEEEQKLLQEMSRLETKGKFENKVPILLTKEMEETMECLTTLRKKCGVMPENKYFFAIPGYINAHHRGSDVLREIRNLSGVQYPKLITSTTLRKEIATLAAVSGLGKNDVSQLAVFLGHTQEVHKKYYRLPEETLQTAKVGKFLVSVSKRTYLSGVRSQKEHEPSRTETGGNHSNEEKDKEEEEEEEEEDKITTVSSVKPKRNFTKQLWNDEEKQIVHREMIQFILRRKLPGKQECEECVAKMPKSSRRKWTHIKYFVRNAIEKEKKLKG